MTNIINTRDREIATLFMNTPTLQYSEVGRMYNLSRERIRQIVARYDVSRSRKQDVVKDKTELQLLKESGLNYCGSCHATDKPLMKATFNHGKQYYRCRDCNNTRCNKYYHAKQK